MTTRRALRDPEQRKNELRKEQDQHPQDTSAPTRTLNLLKRRKHLLRKPVTPREARITSELLSSSDLLQIGEIGLRPGAPVTLLARALSAQIAEMDVTLDVIVEPVSVDPEHPSLKIYVDSTDSDATGIAHTQKVAASLVGMVR